MFPFLVKNESEIGKTRYNAVMAG